MRDYRFYEMSAQEFEDLVIKICQKVLGMGTICFSEGPDGGRDGLFNGTANKFPSIKKSWSGKFIIQAKRTTNQMASCSDADFKTKILDKEITKLKKLKELKEIDNYIIFTNRKMSGGAHSKHIKYLKEHTAIANVEILGVELINKLIETDDDIRKACNLNKFHDPLRIQAEDLQNVIAAFRNSRNELGSACEKGRYSYKYINIEEKNKMNKLSEEYFQYIKDSSESYFNDIALFLQNPINQTYADEYYNITDEIRSKLTIRRDEFAAFEEAFEILYDIVIDKCPEVKKTRRLVNVFLHYMYCSCDIGKK